jgi:hypothetical protein
MRRTMHVSATLALKSSRLLCLKARKTAFGLALTSLTLLVLAGCGKKENITIQATNSPNQTGGALTITGSGFTPGNAVSVGVLNVPGAATWHQSAGKADTGGNINVTVAYSYAPTTNPLPGCKTDNSTAVTLNVTGTDDVTHAFGATNVGVPDCGWATPQVSNHQ